MDHSLVLEEIFDKGYATHTFDLVPDKLTVTIKSLAGDDFIGIDDLMMDQKGSKLKIYQLYGLYKLAYALVKYKNLTFTVDPLNKPTEAFNFLSKLAAPLVDKMLKEQVTFEKDVRAALKMDEVDESFFEKAVLPANPEPLQEESTSENPAA